METETLVTNQEAPAVTTLSQKDAVYQFAAEALASAGSVPNDGQAVRDLVTKEVRKSIRLKLFSGVKTGQIKLARSMDDSKLKKYCSSLINNWLKKDPRFN
jgi:hypothetical protein